jgi:serine/threonine protein kinase
MNFADLIGQTLDEKYLIERELGRGGMGTVYLATHVGTERPVAVKVIAPQYMERAEFIERFRREARAAGRLRHPNVVNVTDFGFSDTSEGRVAYLVMEYLDGCTLGEILEEEKSLPVPWTIDILEQVCSAVHEAHQQGIIHRDLKPDNIWLEPNQRGGYTVKVLDFGIAKLEEAVANENRDPGAAFAALQDSQSVSTFADIQDASTIAIAGSGTLAGEASTVIQQTDGATAVAESRTIAEPNVQFTESKTAIMPGTEAKRTDKHLAGTRLISDADHLSSGDHRSTDDAIQGKTTSDLTRVGAVLGTPLYMSPEQCRGERLDPRSDVYSLGVIAYQMLSGSTPFKGDFADVMTAHRETPPAPIRTKGVRKKVKKVIHHALEKDPDKRPQTAEAFAGVLRAQSEGLAALLRRAVVIYSEHLPKFLGLTALFSIPIILLSIATVVLRFLSVSETFSEPVIQICLAVVSLLLSVFSGFCTYLVFGATTWLVAEHLAVPLRPLKVKPAIAEIRRRWKAFATTSILHGVLTFVLGIITLGLGFIFSAVAWTLFAPVVMMESLRGWKALKRSQQLVRRSIRTTIAAVFLTFLIPAIFSLSIWYVVMVSAKAFDPQKSSEAEVSQQQTTVESNPTATEPAERRPNFGFSIGKVKLGGKDKDMRSRVRETLLESVVQITWMPMHIFVASFTAIIIALLYLKTRQAGGEVTHEFLAKFEEAEPSRKKWQERVRQRLIQSGRITSKPT